MDEKWKNGAVEGWMDGWMISLIDGWWSSTMDGLIARIIKEWIVRWMDGWMMAEWMRGMEGWILLGCISIYCSILLSSQEQQQHNIDRETVAFPCFHPEMTAVGFFFSSW